MVRWVGVQNIDPPERLLVGTVAPDAIFISAYQTQLVPGTSIVYTVPVGTNYFYLTKYTLTAHGNGDRWARLEIYDDIPTLIHYLDMVLTYNKLNQNVNGPVIPSLRIPPTYSIRLTVNGTMINAWAIIRGYLSNYIY